MQYLLHTLETLDEVLSYIMAYYQLLVEAKPTRSGGEEFAGVRLTDKDGNVFATASGRFGNVPESALLT